MPELMLFWAVVYVLVQVARKRREPTNDPLCANCAYAHIQHAMSGRRAISCTFAGGVRPITMDVLYCTDHRDRHAAAPVKTVGFVLPATEESFLAEVAEIERDVASA